MHSDKVPDEFIGIIGWSTHVEPGEWISTLNGDCYLVVEPSVKTDETSWGYETAVDVRTKRSSGAKS